MLSNSGKDEVDNSITESYTLRVHVCISKFGREKNSRGCGGGVVMLFLLMLWLLLDVVVVKVVVGRDAILYE